MTPIIGDAIEGILKNTIGKGVDALIGKYLPASMTETEKEAVHLEFINAAMEQYKTEIEAVKAVNETMQAEAKSEHWIQYSWRPFFGFTCIGLIVNNYILVPYSKALGLGVEVLVIPSEIWIMMMAVLGVAAYTRGQEKTAKINKG